MSPSRDERKNTEPNPDRTTRELVRAFQEGREDAFDEIVKRYRDYIYNKTFYFTGDEKTAEDLAQKTFVKAYRNLEDFRGDASLKTWLYRIARNLCYDHHRKQNRNREYPSGLFQRKDNEENPGPPSRDKKSERPTRRVEQKEIVQIVRETIQDMRPEFRSILILRELEDHSYDEMSRILDIPVGTVRSRLYRARKKLKEILTEAYDGDLSSLL